MPAMSIPVTAGKFEAGVERLHADTPVNSKRAKNVAVFRSDIEFPFRLITITKKRI
jgi:hypothetical protein